MFMQEKAVKEKEVITVEALQEKLTKKEPVFIVDVRPTDQRKEWRIAESIHLDAYKRLNAGDSAAMEEIVVPDNTTVVTVCAAGRTSLIASRALQEKGIQAYSLEGGMKAWNYAWNSAELILDNGIKVIQVRRPAKGILSYIVGSGKEAMVIDAALDPQVYQKIAAGNGWTIKYVTDTHIHADYVSRTRELAKVASATHLLMEGTPVEFQTSLISPGHSINFGNIEIEFMHTPGHTWESATLKLGDQVLFTGDTLFIDGIGRPDLKADPDEAVKKSLALYKSLRQIFSAKPDMLVLPAHTSGAIAFDNKIICDQIKTISKRISVANLSEAEFVEHTLSRIPPAPPNYLTIATLNKKGSYAGHELAELEAGGNHCALT